MMKQLTTLIALILLSGCTSYPRYRSHPPVTPERKTDSATGLTTDQFDRLSLLLQEELGRPYRGKSKFRDGLDCSLFTQSVFRRFNHTVLPRTAAEQFKTGRQIPRRLLRFGDLVFFRTDRHKISHVGIYVGHNEFVHATTSRGVIISSMSEKYWARRYVGARRIIGLPPAEK